MACIHMGLNPSTVAVDEKQGIAIQFGKLGNNGIIEA